MRMQFFILCKYFYYISVCRKILLSNHDYKICFHEFMSVGPDNLHQIVSPVLPADFNRSNLKFLHL